MTPEDIKKLKKARRLINEVLGEEDETPVQTQDDGSLGGSAGGPGEGPGPRP